MLPLNINRKAYGEPIDMITFDFSDFEKLMSRSLRFRSIMSLKGSELAVCYY